MNSQSVSRASSTATMHSQYTGTETISDARFDGIQRNDNAETFRPPQRSNQVSHGTQFDFFAHEHQAISLKQKLMRLFCCR